MKTVDVLRSLKDAWIGGHDERLGQLLCAAEALALETAEHALEFGRVALSFHRHTYATDFFGRAAAKYPLDYRFPEHLVDCAFQVGDADSAVEAYEQALGKGMPLQTEAIRRAARVAVWCGRGERLAGLLRLDGASSYQAEAAELLATDRLSQKALSEKKFQALGTRTPNADDINKATTDGDLPFASYLFRLATQSDQGGFDQSLDVIHRAYPPFGHNAAMLAHAAWCLWRRFPLEPMASVELGIAILQFADVDGASKLLNSALGRIRPDGVGPSSANRILKLAASCSVFGGFAPSSLPTLVDRLWCELPNREHALASIAFASRSPREPRRVVPAGDRMAVALCVSGQLRNYKSSWRTVSDAFSEQDVTTFVSTWSSTGHGLGTGIGIQRRLPPGVVGRVPEHFLTRDYFRARYPRTLALLESDTAVDIDDCRREFNTQYVRVRDEQRFEKDLADTPGLLMGGNWNQAKMYFGIHDAIEMKREFERSSKKKFDVVVRIRPDLSISGCVATDLRLAARERVMLSTHPRLSAIGDIMFAMNSASSDVIGSMWERMLTIGAFSIVPGASGGAAEAALFETALWEGISVMEFRATKAVALSSIAVTASELWTSLAQDMGDKASMNDDDRLLAYVVKSLAVIDNTATHDGAPT